MKILLGICAALCMTIAAWGQKAYQLASPNGEIKLNVNVSDKIQYDIVCG